MGNMKRPSKLLGGLCGLVFGAGCSVPLSNVNNDTSFGNENVSINEKNREATAPKTSILRTITKNIKPTILNTLINTLINAIISILPYP